MENICRGCQRPFRGVNEVCRCKASVVFAESEENGRKIISECRELALYLYSVRSPTKNLQDMLPMPYGACSNSSTSGHSPEGRVKKRHSS